MFLGLLTFATESPRILVKQGKRREAKVALRKLRGGKVNGRALEQEISGIETQLAMEQEKKSIVLFRSLWSLFTTKRSFNRLCTACTAHLMQVWSGASSITVYAPQYFEILGIRDSQERLLYTAVIGIVKLAAATACAVFCRRPNRPSEVADHGSDGAARVHFLHRCSTVRRPGARGK